MRFAPAFVLLVLGLASLEQAVAKCNPKKDDSCYLALTAACDLGRLREV